MGQWEGVFGFLTLIQWSAGSSAAVPLCLARSRGASPHSSFQGEWRV